ncbi:EMG1/NEP1 methyltransferase family protein [Leishmania donovani]|uniref:EMG1/NEP1 methyltransferase family protein n=1 Tax=Leishmania donovani TaxID=5661 RepID=A0A504WWG9_LEIDO|nr:EMG1/NEP1 methyltransferase family protein [Leishmania donovani]
MEYAHKSARLPRSAEEKERWKRVIVILEHCPLQTIQTDRGFELLSDRHRSYHARHNQDPADWRPDVVHQCLLHLQDSPLNRAGMLEVFLRTKKQVCIAVDPRLRVPRNVRLFEKMMVSLLFKLKVRASTGYLSLLRVVGNPITDHIPAGTRLYRVEKDGDLIDPFTFCASCGYAADVLDKQRVGSKISLAHRRLTSSTSGTLEETTAEAGTEEFAKAQRKAVERRQFQPFAFIVGGMSRGDVSVDYARPGEVSSIRLGDRGMSAAAVISTLLHGFEEEWLREDNEAC